MRDDYDSRGFGKFVAKFLDFARRYGVERACRLVHKKNFRLDRKGARYAKSLLLSARKSERGFVEAVKEQKQTPIDVYDTASWMAITPLSEDSIACGSMPVAIPDFTNGKWLRREAPTRSKYCLEEVCEELF